MGRSPSLPQLRIRPFSEKQTHPAAHSVGLWRVQSDLLTRQTLPEASQGVGVRTDKLQALPGSSIPIGSMKTFSHSLIIHTFIPGTWKVGELNPLHVIPYGLAWLLGNIASQSQHGTEAELRTVPTLSSNLRKCLLRRIVYHLEGIDATLSCYRCVKNLHDHSLPLFSRTGSRNGVGTFGPGHQLRISRISSRRAIQTVLLSGPLASQVVMFPNAFYFDIY
ncbi:unnamed protein product [Nesidiocoris tenuis]|uniref:Uncharacterized protein n=1 Tax=Nesidiocoris tenuis TaxID=355587 RepID=A0A6H5H1E7_9HEMI|nr:unnamed protein product [Nesidiocoris tenuis]